MDRLEARIDGVTASLGARIDRSIGAQTLRIESMIWKAAFAVLGGTPAIGGPLIRFMR